MEDKPPVGLGSDGKLNSKGNRRGASPERMRELLQLRNEMAKTDPSKKGGRRRAKFTKAEVEEATLRRLMPRALQVLESQLESPDERVSQAAAIKVMEYVRGKPQQSIKQMTDQVTTIRYESAAWSVQQPKQIEGAEVVEAADAPLELPPPSDPDGTLGA